MRLPSAAWRVAGMLCLLAPRFASAQVTPDPRAEFAGFASALDAAVRRVSRPSLMLAGREATRAYRLAGFGALFVLPPRSLPAAATRSASERAAARAVREAIRHLEQALKTAVSPDVRQQMETSLRVLRLTQAELRGPAPDAVSSVFFLNPPASPDVVVRAQVEPAHPESMRLQALQRELETQMAAQMRALQEAERTQGERARARAREMESEVHELQAQMEAVRREVEEARVEAERRVEMRLGNANPPADLPEAPAVPMRPLPGSNAIPAPAPAAPALAPPVPPPVAPPAPWQLWFRGEEPADGRSGEAVIRDVKAAVTGLMERQGGLLRQLRPDEYVAVAVDFVRNGPLLAEGRVQKTLVVKVRKRDLDERRAGRLGADELRRRIDYAEY
ncbi:MAG: hypothetical protein DMF80_15190 [Acidobacteria bacterium]|nr:MAG: hypothetical protein DMF80_15190 [Acidobacteriota bacterium]PYQ23468.1 MAG: hypothetical protein DMF81_08730 [Acidobacteriota bacterium]